MKPWIVTVAMVLSAAAATAQPASDQLLVQHPALSRTHIVFVYAGDLWSVPREGGAARRLTAGPGRRDQPVVLARRKPHRLHRRVRRQRRRLRDAGRGRRAEAAHVAPGAPTRVMGWTPDGKRVLFASTRTAYSRFSELFTVGLEGGLPDKLPLPMAAEGAFSPDGSRIAYVPLQRAFNTWKRYRGGRRRRSGSPRLADSRVEKLPRENSNDFNPMWVGDTVYFLSDRDGRATLYAYDTGTKKTAQAVRQRRPRLQVGLGRPGRDRLRAVRVARPVRPEDRQAKPVPVTVAGRLPRGPRAAAAGRLGADQRATSRPPARAPCSRRTARSSRCRPRRAIPRNLTETPGRHGARPRVVARRQVDRLLLRRERRVRAARAAAVGHGRDDQDRARRQAVDLLLRRAGRPTARRSPTSTATRRCGTWTSTRRKPMRVDQRPVLEPIGRHAARPRGRPTRSGSPTRSGCRTTWAPSSSTRSTTGRARRSPTG